MEHTSECRAPSNHQQPTLHSTLPSTLLSTLHSTLHSALHSALHSTLQERRVPPWPSAPKNGAVTVTLLPVVGLLQRGKGHAKRVPPGYPRPGSPDCRSLPLWSWPLPPPLPADPSPPSATAESRRIPSPWPDAAVQLSQHSILHPTTGLLAGRGGRNLGGMGSGNGNGGEGGARWRTCAAPAVSSTASRTMEPNRESVISVCASACSTGPHSAHPGALSG